jgi:hypothetical protein
VSIKKTIRPFTKPFIYEPILQAAASRPLSLSFLVDLDWDVISSVWFDLIPPDVLNKGPYRPICVFRSEVVSSKEVDKSVLCREQTQLFVCLSELVSDFASEKNARDRFADVCEHAGVDVLFPKPGGCQTGRS